MNHLRPLLCLLVCFVVLRVDVRQACAQNRFIDQVPGIKADSLMLFGYYFKWPKNAVPGDEFVIGVLGDAAFSKARVTQRTDKVGKKKIRVLLFDSAKDYKPCHILFVANSATPNSVEKTPKTRLSAGMKQVADSPVLVIAEDAGAAIRGAMANFVVDTVQNRVNIEVNEAAVKAGRIDFTRFYLDFRKTRKCIVVQPDRPGD